MLLAGCAAGAQTAEQTPQQTHWDASLALTSDYVYQGLSQTRGRPAWQAGVRMQPAANWTVGVWASQIDRGFDPSASAEIDVYATRSWRVSDAWSATVALTHLEFPGDPRPRRYDRDELSVSIAYGSAVFATATWSPNTSEFAYEYGLATDRSAASYEIVAVQPLSGPWSCTVGAGYRDLTALFNDSYWYGHAGLMRAGRSMSLHLTYIVADDAAQRLFGRERASGRVSASVVWRFGAAH
jgi:uncharacterized protein (TIGR02001 family)